MLALSKILAGLLLAFVLSAGFSAVASPVKTAVVQADQGWQLQRGGQPFFIKGAGGTASLALLKQTGGNSLRTWSVDGLQAQLDEAQKLGLTVCVGIWLHHENDTEKFSYRNPEMVGKQLEFVRECILKFKDHPAVLLWGIGNEMEGDAGDKAEIWQAVQAAAKLAKQLDANHPTMTVIAEIGGQKIPNLHKYCPDIDIVGINSYGGGASLAERYVRSGATKPYIVTEFGPIGPWETGKTRWGAAYEPTSTEKAASYRRTYEKSVANQPLCLGSYAFLWGQKQENTVTWFGMFLKDGTKVQAVDTMSELWAGQPVKQPCPVIRHLKLNGNPEMNPGDNFAAELDCTDPTGQPLQVRWVIQPEQHTKLSAGAEEKTLPEFTSHILHGDLKRAEVSAPAEPGGYRLFAYVSNGSGAAVANVPFRVLGAPASITKPVRLSTAD